MFYNTYNKSTNKGRNFFLLFLFFPQRVFFYIEKHLFWIGCLFFSVWSGLSCKAQESYAFLGVPYATKNTSLSSRVISDMHDTYLLDYFVNPAVNSQSDTQKLGVSYTNYIADIQHGMLAYQHSIKNQNIHTALQYMNYGTFQGYDIEGNPVGEFSASDTVFKIGTSFGLGILPKERFRIGVNVSTFYSVYEQYNALGTFATLGISYCLSTKRHQFGFVCDRVGFLWNRYTENSQSIIPVFSLGYTYQFTRIPLKVHATFQDVVWFSRYSGGYSFWDTFRLAMVLFPDKKFSILAGYHPILQENLRVASQTVKSSVGWSFGLQLRLKRTLLECGYASMHQASNNLTFGIQFALSQ